MQEKYFVSDIDINWFYCYYQHSMNIRGLTRCKPLCFFLCSSKRILSASLLLYKMGEQNRILLYNILSPLFSPLSLSLWDISLILHIQNLHTVVLATLIKPTKNTWSNSPPEIGRIFMFYGQKVALHKAFSPSPHRRWTSFILSTDLQTPLQVQSNDATQTLPAWAFHSQSGIRNKEQYLK